MKNAIITKEYRPFQGYKWIIRVDSSIVHETFSEFDALKYCERKQLVPSS